MTDKAVDKPKMGRPSAYSDELAEELCLRLIGAEGGEARSLVSVCRDDDMPCARTVFRWLDDPNMSDFSHKYQRARDHRTEVIFEEMRDIASTPLDGEKVTVKESEKGIFRDTTTGDNVERSKLMINTAQWQLARMAPKKFGDKVEVNSKVDITKHYGDDDLDILNRHIEQKAAELIQTRNKEKNNGDQIDEP